MAMAGLDIRRLNTADADFELNFAALREYDPASDAGLQATVDEILAAVKRQGDSAVMDYTQRFDRRTETSVAELEVSADQLKDALEGLDAGLRQALQTAALRIRRYAEHQRLTSWSFEDEDGNRLGQQVTPLDRVGLYVPGGKASYPSSVLMNAIPAKVAGVPEVIMVVPAPAGEINQLVLAAAALAEVDRVFTIGGAQAVAALAYGTATIPAVDKIVGPGNAYVAAAKRSVFGTVGIDMIAGPSEIMVIADDSANPSWLAVDLFSQAEHDEQAQSILLSADAALLDAVADAMVEELKHMPRADIIRASLNGRGALIQVADLDEAASIANRIAPEHLELAVADPQALQAKIRHAGAIFLGHHTPEAFGDYCAGPNHVLPTAGSARFSSPLGVYDFQKRSSIIQASVAGAQELAPVAAKLAEAEGLVAHGRSATLRLAASGKDSRGD